VTDSDRLRRFLFERWPVRGQFVRLDAAWRAVIEHHDYPPVLTRCLGEAVAATTLVAGTLKFKGRLLMQCQGPGPVHLVVAECTDRHAIRGLLRHRGELPADASLAALTGGGQLAVTLDNPQHTNRYQGVVPLAHPGLAACLEDYFGRSEQLPTRLVLAANAERAGGLLLQRVASGASASRPENPVAAEEAEDAWRRIGLLADTLTPEELLRQPLEVILHRLFHEDDVRVFEGSPVFFQCVCSRERVAGILRSLGQEEIRDILAERGQVEVRCEFCNRAYQFDAVDATRVFAGGSHPPSPSGGLH
jgi:molecular chaperone Hsp33